MMEVGIVQAKTVKPSRKLMAEWIADSLDALGAGLIESAWRRTNYSYFPTEPDLMAQTYGGEEPDGMLEDFDSQKEAEAYGEAYMATDAEDTIGGLMTTTI